MIRARFRLATRRIGPLCLAAVWPILGSAVLAGCGGSDGDASTFTPVAGTESAYCDTYRAWQVYKLDHGEGDDPRSPAAFRVWWNEYLIFNETSLKQAPAAIRAEWALLVGAIRTRLTPVLEKYDFDLQRMAAEGTPAEKAAAEPSPAREKALKPLFAYEERVCGVDLPPAADVVFEADGSSETYCAALSTLNSNFEKGESSRGDPDVMRTVFTADSFTGALDRVVETAPDVIAADVAAEAEWLRTRWRDVFAKFGYDIRRVYVDGTPEDRAVFTLSHPDVVEHVARDKAYEEQVCGG
jgi:hypothetical protein